MPQQALNLEVQKDTNANVRSRLIQAFYHEIEKSHGTFPLTKLITENRKQKSYRKKEKVHLTPISAYEINTSSTTLEPANCLIHKLWNA
ncbi:Cobyric acid synthase [Frankliniella fusca]|uniref:Cobyric acid synthase n=1 Tax=Frankliniella fusca TaxID=407009 RepID=A0AAE1HTE7_9NEOP|nr:Cobyric acid synthase [Frankliniella fusca]